MPDQPQSQPSPAPQDLQPAVHSRPIPPIDSADDTNRQPGEEEDPPPPTPPPPPPDGSSIDRGPSDRDWPMSLGHSALRGMGREVLRGDDDGELPPPKPPEDASSTNRGPK
jgi:hypothetical protein